jgi:hypothetical protein
MKNHRLMRLLGVVQEGAHPIASFRLIERDRTKRYRERGDRNHLIPCDNAWSYSLPWLVGSNYAPSAAIYRRTRPKRLIY